MTNPLKKLLELLAVRPVGQIAACTIGELFSNEAIVGLKAAAILQDGELSKTVSCASCDGEHRIEWNKLPDGRFLALCDRNENTAPQSVSRDEVATIQVETSTFLTSFGCALGAEIDIKQLVADELWEVGAITVAKRKRKVLFLRDDTSQRHVELINALSQSTPVIVFSIHSPALGMTEQVSFIDPTLFVSLDEKGLRADIKALETAVQGSGQRVFLNQNGDLTLDGKTLCNIPRHTVEFSFVERLMQDYAYPVSHAELYRYCTETHEVDSARTAQKYCNDYRSNVTKLAKKARNEATVNKIIVGTKTAGGENAYKIQNPIEKVTAK